MTIGCRFHHEVVVVRFLPAAWLNLALPLQCLFCFSRSVFSLCEDSILFSVWRGWCQWLPPSRVHKSAVCLFFVLLFNLFCCWVGVPFFCLSSFWIPNSFSFIFCKTSPILGNGMCHKNRESEFDFMVAIHFVSPWYDPPCFAYLSRCISSWQSNKSLIYNTIPVAWSSCPSLAPGNCWNCSFYLVLLFSVPFPSSHALIK